MDSLVNIILKIQSDSLSGFVFIKLSISLMILNLRLDLRPAIKPAGLLAGLGSNVPFPLSYHHLLNLYWDGKHPIYIKALDIYLSH